MSYKKKYKEALEVAKRKLCFDKAGMVDSFTPNDIYEIFPELKENEDERIRKEILDCFRAMKQQGCFPSKHKEQYDSWIVWLEKQGEKPQGKTALEAINEEKVDNANKVEPKFKVKYAGSEYNVLEVKDIAGVAFYGIEDEPNHIDYVQAENCERVDGYSIKESGSPFPTKPAKFSEQNSTWSEEDEAMLDDIIDFLEKGTVKLQHDLSLYASWLKSLKYRYTWKPSDEQMDALDGICSYIRNKADWEISQDMVSDLYKLSEQLKKLKGE